MGVFSWVAFGIRTVGGILQVAGFGIVAIQLFADQRDAGDRPIPDLVRDWLVNQWRRLRGKDVGYGVIYHTSLEVPAPPPPPPPFAPAAPDAGPGPRLDTLERHAALQDDAIAKARRDLTQHHEHHRRRDESGRERQGEEQATLRNRLGRELFILTLFGVGVLLASWPDLIYCAVGRVL